MDSRSPAEASIPLVITGMHRSGTSMLASAMQAAGVAIGDELLGPSRSNRKGHFEDRDFLDLHEAIFADHGRTVYDAPEAGPLEVPPARRRQAESLVAARSHLPLWGWKDPRTCLFLDFWASMLPRARFLLIVRDPDEVVASLRTRRHPELQWNFRGVWLLRKVGIDPFRRGLALRWWLAYNGAILDFATREPGRCRVVELGRIHEQLPKAVAAMREEWGMPLRDVELAGIYDEELLHGAGGPRWRWSREVRERWSGLRVLARSPDA